MKILDKFYCFMFGHAEPVQYSHFSLRVEIYDDKTIFKNKKLTTSKNIYCSDCGELLKE